MAAVYLHGHLGEIYGHRFDLAVHSVAEALRLLNANFKGFTAAIINHKPGFVVRVDGETAVDMQMLRSTRISPEIHIVPAVIGAGGNNNGIGQILMAVVLVAAAYYGGFSPATTSALYSAGLNMAISGVATMLFSTTSTTADTSNDLTGEKNLANYAFNGPVNTTAQGNPVPVLYGRLRVGSQVVSAGISSS